MNGAKYMFGTAFALLSALPIVAETIFLSKSVHSPQAYPSETTRAAAFVDSAMISITGEHAVWDFSGMSAGVEHVVKAGQKNDTLFAVFAGRGLTDFLLIGDTVKKSAYVDRSKRLEYRVAETEMVFPFVYRDSVGSYFFSEGNFGESSYLRISGHASVKADASGTLILPDGDTVRNVLRLHLHREGGFVLDAARKYAEAAADSAVFSIDSIKWQMQSDMFKHVTDQWAWFSKNNPLPILEKTDISILHGGNVVESQTDAYLIPSSFQPFESPTEEEEEWAEERYEALKQAASKGGKPTRAAASGSDGCGGDAPLEFVVAPKLVESTFQIHCQGVPRNAHVSIYAASGVLVRSYGNDSGDLQFPLTCDLSGMASGVYVVSVVYGDGRVYSESIMKE